MANTQVFATQNINQNFTQNNQERMGIQNRTTQVFRPNNERIGTSNTANVLIVDVSTSMRASIGNGKKISKIDGAKNSVCSFITGLPSSAYLSIITFDSQAKVIYPMSQVGSNKLDMIQKVQQIHAGGSTDMSGGFKLAEQESKKIPKGLLVRYFVLSDGMPNSDPTSRAKRAKNQNVQITTIGYGDQQIGLDEDLLRKIASKSANGTPLYYYIDSAEKLTVFMRRSSVNIAN